MEKLSLKIGGKAVVFEGTTVKVRCPRRRVDDLDNDLQRVDWFKDGKKISSSHKLYITSKQALRIKRVSRDDSAIYSCSVSGSHAQLILSVKDSKGMELPTVDIVSKKNKKRRKNINRRRKITRLHGPNEVLPTSADDFLETSSGSSRYFLANDQTFRSKSRTPSSGESLASSGRRDGSSDHGLQVTTNMDATNIDMTNTKNDVLESGAVSSSASRTTSDFGHLFSSLRNSFSLPTHPQDVIYRDADSGDHFSPSSGNNSPRRTKSIDHKRDGLFLDGVSSSKDLVSLMGKNSVSDLDFTWINSPWSSCSQPCGAIGIQVRGTQCVVKSGSMTKVVDEQLCHDAGLAKPQFLRDCQTPCVKWMETEWTQCRECLKNGIGRKTREVKCVSLNGTVVMEEECPANEKPETLGQCPKESCQAVWVTGPWSDVSYLFLWD
jgi:hypothetical protein